MPDAGRFVIGVVRGRWWTVVVAVGWRRLVGLRSAVGRTFHCVLGGSELVADPVEDGLAGGLIRCSVAQQRLRGDEDAQVRANTVDGGQPAGTKHLADDRHEGVGAALISAPRVVSPRWCHGGI
jgi:hypothetical protein